MDIHAELPIESQKGAAAKEIKKYRNEIRKMKALILAAGILSSVALFAQDTLKYDYAILNIFPAKHKAVVNYSNGDIENLKIIEGPEMLDTNKVFKMDLMIFRGFERMNDEGFELTGMLLGKGRGSLLRCRREYYFKRPRKNNYL